MGDLELQVSLRRRLSLRDRALLVVLLLVLLLEQKQFLEHDLRRQVGRQSLRILLVVDFDALAGLLPSHDDVALLERVADNRGG